MRFFVSYASEDEQWAKWIVWELENAKARYQCIVQFRDFAPGMSFMQKMQEAAESDCTIALFSSNYFSSNFCRQELDAALTNDRLLPVRVARCDPGNFLRSRIYIDLAGRALDDARQALLWGMEAYVSQTVHRQRSHKFVERPDYPGKTKARPAPAPRKVAVRTGPVNVLFLAPEVGGLSPRRQLEEMASAVAEVRTSSPLRFTGIFDAHVDDLFKELNTRAPDILHFSGKQNGGDILMRTPEGGLTTIPDTALAGMFKSLDVGLKLVIIDTCSSLRCAKTIARVVPFAIGVEGSPYEEDTITFYKVFYHALAAGHSLRHAVGQAQTALKFARVKSDCIPQVCCSDAYNPADVYFVTSRPAAKKRSAGGRT